MDDFKAALSKVGPSMQRGFKVSVEATRWEDVGGLQDVKKVNFYLFFSYRTPITDILSIPF
jgi:hypothetical protein